MYTGKLYCLMVKVAVDNVSVYTLNEFKMKGLLTKKLMTFVLLGALGIAT